MTARFLNNRDGAAALETALVAPIFITMVLAIFQVGWALYCGAEVRHAVERSTRLLIADPTTTESAIEAAIAGQLDAVNPADVNLTMTTEAIGADGQIARLTWTYGYTIDAPFIDPAVLDFGSSIVVPLRG
ncbi:MAG TPA: TadE/TadG family type IV pilus assembly protein [Caulobacteraceae bacterium]|nr:TadE/TadG family type IV pilus assembly protein [Caulobacteraceae bacterium]